MNDKDRSDLDHLLSELEASQELSEENAVTDGTRAQFDESPTLSTLDEKRRPEPMPVCGPCPHSMWFASGEELKCYCRIMHVITWTSDEPVPITACDGILLPD